MVKPAPEATRAELAELISTIRAKRAEGYTVGDYQGEYWCVERVAHPKTGAKMWAELCIALAEDGSDRLQGGQRVVLKGSRGYDGQDEQYHINDAVQRNKRLLRRAIKILGARMVDEGSPVSEPGRAPRPTYTWDDLNATIAYLRTLAPRASGYETAERSDHPTLPGWAAVFYYLNDDGSDAVRADGSRVSPLSTRCGSEELAVREATEGNIDRIDKIMRAQWFTKSESRKVRYPREKSPALHEAAQHA
jgi:hypothetical protein